MVYPIIRRILLPRWPWLSARYQARISHQKAGAASFAAARVSRHGGGDTRANLAAERPAGPVLPLLGARIGPGRNQATGSSIGNCRGGRASDCSDRVVTLRSDLVFRPRADRQALICRLAAGSGWAGVFAYAVPAGGLGASAGRGLGR